VHQNVGLELSSLRNPGMDKKKLSEADICLKFITPALQRAGWDIHDQVFMNFTLKPGRMVVHGPQAERDKKSALFADYILCYKAGLPIAAIEAKDNNHAIGAGMMQAIKYAELLEAPFAIASNGDGFILRDSTGNAAELERTLSLEEFPSPNALWERYCDWKGWSPDTREITETPYQPGKPLRYYQVNAINRTVEAIAQGRDRILLVMATGTGKTYTAFQIIWRLWKSGAKKRILFLADRNILVDQTMVNDFKPFKGAMAKLSPNQKGIERVDAETGRRYIEDIDVAVSRSTKLVDKSYEIYLSLYQAVSGREEESNVYRQFSRDFFDLVIVDECHRGSANEDSAWRDILEYFSSATQIGMTATPKETRDTSNTEYFGGPLYTYSLKQGIEDGFLAPYKVIRVDIDKDVLGWRPSAGMADKHGEVIEDRIYSSTDINRILVLEERDRLVAKKITEYLKTIDRYAKTIVFCEDIDHANRMRQVLANENADLCIQNSKYVVQITGDNNEGKLELDNFIDPEKPFPVIAVTSKLMSTGVDAQTCKLIVLDQTIKSMTLFKQIIGRGTRINEEYGKRWFTIMDFKRATDNFADPEFDGEPVVVYEPKGDEPIVPPSDIIEPNVSTAGGPVKAYDDIWTDSGGARPKKYVIGNQVQVTVLREQVQYMGPDGKLITQSLRDYTRLNIRKQYESLDQFLAAWKQADRKAAIIQELESRGVLIEALKDDVGKDLDPFDLILHVAFGQPPLTRRERANNVKKRNVFTKYGTVARQVIDALIDKYADEGIETIENIEVLRVAPIAHLGSPAELVKSFGGRPKYLAALRTLETALYS